MKVGLTISEYASLNSLKRFTTNTYESLSAGHELVLLPREYPLASPAERGRIAEDFLRRCDVVVGMLEPGLLAARRRLRSSVPFATIMHGDLPVGAWNLRNALADLTTGDVLVVTSTSEVEIAHRLFRNATVAVLPFAYDVDTFFPLDDGERRAARERLGFGEGDRIVLYSGRVNPEKNVHWLLRIFDVVCRRVPDARLVLAGSAPTERTYMDLFGTEPVWLQNTYSRLISELDHPERVHFGPGDDRRLRELYNVADVVVNLTLNPDENFGMAQVEAMACGTPVVGTAWGGLKDTIVDGVSGYRVSTVPTATGVRLSWWEAVNRVVALLEDRAALGELRGGCLRAAERYTPERYGARMGEILAAAARSRDRPAAPLQPTPFAEELWSVCDPRKPGATFRRGPRSEEIYCALATPFTAPSPAHVAPAEPLEPEQVLSLATPARVDGAARLRLEGVFYPSSLEVPAAHLDAVRAILATLRERPAILAGELAAAAIPGASGALGWMLEAGVVLRTRPMPGWIAPEMVGRRLAEGAFAVQEVDRAATDLTVYTS
jgi:glycosyltransferase involved in cell wall biosynthesis